MKDYYLFPERGAQVKIHKDALGFFRIEIDKDKTATRFTYKQLRTQLLKFFKYVRKYDDAKKR